MGRFTRILGILALGWIWGAPVAQASSVAGVSAKGREFPFAWRNDSFQDCGQECLYGKGTERLSFQALFILRKLQLAQKLRESGDMDALKSGLRDVCLPSDKDADACFRRFKSVSVLQLEQIRQAIARNDQQRLTLESAEDASPAQARLLREGEPEFKRAHTPEIHKFSELSKIYEQNQALRDSVTPSYLEMAQALEAPPSREQFVKIDLIPPGAPAQGLRPANPSNRPRSWIVVKADGTPEYDDAAYAKALKEWQALGGPKAVADQKAEWAGLQKSRDAIHGKAGFADERLMSDLEIEAYKLAREDMVHAGNTRKPEPPMPAKPSQKKAGAQQRGKSVPGVAPAAPQARGLADTSTPQGGVASTKKPAFEVESRIGNRVLSSTSPQPGTTGSRSASSSRVMSPAGVVQEVNLTAPVATGAGKKGAAAEVTPRTMPESDFKMAPPGAPGSESYFLIYRPEDLRNQIDAVIQMK